MFVKNVVWISALLSLSIVSANPLLDKRATSTCNADNCARLITGTSGPATSIPFSRRSADCSSFLQVTVTPSTVTSTVTVTPPASTVATSTLYVVTSTSTFASVQTYPTSTISTSTLTSYSTTITATTTLLNSPNNVKKRATTSNGAVYNSGTIPAYASPSCGTSGSVLSSRYSSACSCLGARQSTTTVLAPSNTVTVTASAASVTYTTTISTYTSTTSISTAATPLTTAQTTIVTATTTTTTVIAPVTTTTIVTNVVTSTVDSTTTTTTTVGIAQIGCSSLPFKKKRSPDSLPTTTPISTVPQAVRINHAKRANPPAASTVTVTSTVSASTTVTVSHTATATQYSGIKLVNSMTQLYLAYDADNAAGDPGGAFVFNAQSSNAAVFSLDTNRNVLLYNGNDVRAYMNSNNNYQLISPTPYGYDVNCVVTSTPSGCVLQCTAHSPFDSGSYSGNNVLDYNAYGVNDQPSQFTVYAVAA